MEADEWSWERKQERRDLGLHTGKPASLWDFYEAMGHR